MHLNTCTIVGPVSKTGLKLTYTSSGTPICSLVVEVDEVAGEKTYTTWLPVEISGRYAEQTSAEVEARMKCRSQANSSTRRASM
jgi:primosomal replication protein N